MTPVKATGEATWFTYLPTDCRWSASICMLISAAQWGGSDIGEVDQVGRTFSRKTGADEHRFQGRTKIGGKVRTFGIRAEKEGNTFSAPAHYKWACLYYQISDRFRQPKDRKALNAFRT